MELKKRVERIKILGCDVDGVLTDGRLYIGAEGELMKAFSARDGMGMKIARREGIDVVFISGRESEIVRARAREIELEEVHLGISDKTAQMEEILKARGLDFSRAAFIGDDLNDLSLLKRVGLACTVPNGAPELKGVVHYITGLPGGQGAVRELLEMILKTQGRWPY